MEMSRRAARLLPATARCIMRRLKDGSHHGESEHHKKGLLRSFIVPRISTFQERAFDADLMKNGAHSGAGPMAGYPFGVMNVNFCLITAREGGDDCAGIMSEEASAAPPLSYSSRSSSLRPHVSWEDLLLHSLQMRQSSGLLHERKEELVEGSLKLPPAGELLLFETSSVKKKRRLKMNKHKQKKLRRRERYKNK